LVTLTAIIKLGCIRIFINNNISPIVLIRKKKVIYTQDGLRVSKAWANFHLKVN